jgi:nucleotide-binding universal stress UspA family protein
MYNKLVVPLDGSDLAEVVLPHVIEISKGCHVTEVFLISVTEAIKGKVSSSVIKGELTSSREFHQIPVGTPIQTGNFATGLIYSPDLNDLKDIPAEVGRMAKTAWNYLSQVSDNLKKEGLLTEIKVLTGNPAQEIIGFAEDENADLIIMASRGRSGLSRWDMGNIADKVIRASNIPVLLIKPKAKFKESKPKRQGKT